MSKHAKAWTPNEAARFKVPRRVPKIVEAFQDPAHEIREEHEVPVSHRLRVPSRIHVALPGMVIACPRVRGPPRPIPLRP